jgi:AraC-like DNA-binding protein
MNSSCTGAEPEPELGFGCISLWHGSQILQRITADRAELLIPTQGALSLGRSGGGEQEQRLQPPYDLLYLPAGMTLIRPMAFQGWRLQLNPQELCRAAVDLSGYRVSPARCRQRLQAIQVLQPRLQPECDQALMLQQLLKVSQSSPRLQGQHLRQIGLDQLILRMLALLLCGGLIQRAGQQSSKRQNRKAQLLEELSAWIRRNLHRSIQLSDLCRQSGYSERSLRNLFQERFQCGPAQWIRQQRMELAREKLLHADASITVTMVAESVGYQHLSQFSRDFHQTFGQRPSELVREARRSEIELQT